MADSRGSTHTRRSQDPRLKLSQDLPPEVTSGYPPKARPGTGGDSSAAAPPSNRAVATGLVAAVTPDSDDTLAVSSDALSHLKKQPLASSQESRPTQSLKKRPGPFRWASRQRTKDYKAEDSTFSDRERRLREIASVSQAQSGSSAEDTPSTWSDGSDRPRVPNVNRSFRNVTRNILRRFNSGSGLGDQRSSFGNSTDSSALPTPTTPKATEDPVFQFDSASRPFDAVDAKQFLASRIASESVAAASAVPTSPTGSRSVSRQSSSNSLGAVPSPYTDAISTRTAKEHDPTKISDGRKAGTPPRLVHRAKSHSDLTEVPEPPQGPNSPDPFPRGALSKTLKREEVDSRDPRPGTHHPTRSDSNVPRLSDKGRAHSSLDLQRARDIDTSNNGSIGGNVPDMASDKGIASWKNRFSSARHSNNEMSGDTNLLDRFNLDKKPGSGSPQARRPRNASDIRTALPGGGDLSQAAENIARGQRSANGSRSASASTPAFKDSSMSHHANRIASSGAGRSKLERMTGEKASELPPPTPRTEPPIRTPDSAFRSSTMGNDAIDESSCPVCLELLSFRLSGEKPHVVPTCGHALHHACFTAVYGSPEAVLAAQSAPGRSQAPGMCGVCRRLIILGEGTGNRRQTSECCRCGVLRTALLGECLSLLSGYSCAWRAGRILARRTTSLRCTALRKAVGAASVDTEALARWNVRARCLL